MKTLEDITGTSSCRREFCEKLLSKCAYELTFRQPRTGIDTVLLRDALNFKEFAFEPYRYGRIYSLIEREFLKNFENLDELALPFSRNSEIHERFLYEVWRSYFFSEAEVIGAENPEFAIYLVTSATQKTRQYECMTLALNLLEKRYSGGTTQMN
jgi:hypothetical protein